MRLNSQSECGKWWSSLQGKGELDVVREFDVPEKFRAPTSNVSFVFIYDYF